MSLVDSGVVRTENGRGDAVVRLDGVSKQYGQGSSALLALDRSGLLGAVAALVARDDVVDGKPHPAPFLRAAEALGAPPRRCLAVEDSPPGVLAAQAAGMRVVMVPDALPPTPELRWAGLAVAADLWEVRALLRRCLRDREAGAA